MSFSASSVIFLDISLIFLFLILILKITPVLALQEGFEKAEKGDIHYRAEIAIPGFPDEEIKVRPNTLGLYITVYFLDSFTVTNINTTSFTWATVNFPPIRLNSFAAFFITTLTINFINNRLKKILIRVKKIKT